MSKGAWLVTALAVVIIWKAPVAAGHFVTETFDKVTMFIGSVFH